MTSILDKLNLRPGERRLVVVVALVVFVLLNLMFVWPQFKEWSRLQKRKDQLRQDTHRFQKEIAQVPAYKKQLAELKKKGVQVADEKQALELQRQVTSLAAMHNVQINSYTPAIRSSSSSGGKTNQFFEEQSGTINFVAEEEDLVNFLYTLSSGDSLIRVRSMTLNPDPTRMKLMGNITLVASYPKSAPPRPTPVAASPPTRPSPAAIAAAKARGDTSGPTSISAAVAAKARPAATNAPPKESWWTKVKKFFTKSSDESEKKPATPAATTNAPAKKT